MNLVKFALKFRITFKSALDGGEELVMSAPVELADGSKVRVAGGAGDAPTSASSDTGARKGAGAP